MGSNNPWNEPNGPWLGRPLAIGSMIPPLQQPKRRGGWMVVLGLFAFAAGLLAGPSAHEQTCALIDHVGPDLATRMPWLFGWLGPGSPVHPAVPVPTPPVGLPRSHVDVTPTVTPVPAPARSHVDVTPTVTPVPAPAPAAEPEAVAAQRRPSAPAAVHAPARAPLAQPARTSHRQLATRQVAAPKAQPVAEAPAQKSGMSHEPFDPDGEDAGERAAARKAKAAAAKEPAPKPAAPRSSDSLDNMMSDVVTDGKGKPKKHDKDIDAMLKDVQKSGPAPVAKREEPAPASLTPSDIAKAMAEVKTRANACAQSLGQSGLAQLKIAVGKDGNVTDVSVGGKVSNTPLGACIEKAVRAATFRPNAGLRFDYRIEAH
jgi:outer membrane biosynthesis protein TonB